MSFDADSLFRLLPAIHRTRDAQLAEALRILLGPVEADELLALEALPNPTIAQGERLGELREKASLCVLAPAEVTELASLAKLSNPTSSESERMAELREKGARGPLKALLMAFAGEIAVVEEDLEQMYENLFIETCAEWVVPYIGDLLGSEPLHALDRHPGLARAEVAHTIALRRRKGTVAVLEQLARDLTGWNARAVEYFQLLATNQYMNHVRRKNVVAPSMRHGDALEWVGSAFDPFPRSLEVRRIASRGGRYNIPNIGIFVWRIDANRLRESPATPDPDDAAGLRMRFSPLGHDTPLYTRPEAEDEITHLAEPINVPVPISRRVLHRDISRHQDDGTSLYYGPGRSLLLHVGDDRVPITKVAVCNLSDEGGAWAHDAPPGKIAIDPVLGRLAVAGDVTVAGPLRVTYHYGALGQLGGGEYMAVRTESPRGLVLQVPDDHAQIQDALDALDALGGAGVVEITDNGHYEEALAITVAADQTVELRAALGKRPTVNLTAPMTLTGAAGSSVVVSGLVIAGNAVTVPAASNRLRRLRLVHTTLVPGISLTSDGAPVKPGTPSLVVRRPDVKVVVERSIVGAMRIDPGSTARIEDSIVDACAPESLAYAAPGGGDPGPGGELDLEASTIVGTTRCRLLQASNSILLGRADVTRRQEGCVRFSFVPLESSTPRRFLCQPTPGEGLANHPRFTSLRYATPAYGQLTARTPPAIRSGADDESEMGAFHFLYQPQLESNLATRLDEYLRAGLQAGIFYES